MYVIVVFKLLLLNEEDKMYALSQFWKTTSVQQHKMMHFFLKRTKQKK